MKDMELYDSFIRETNDLLGAPTQKWAYKERDAWKDNGESELVLLRDAAYELGGGANEAVNFTCVTSDAALVPSDEVLLYGPDMKEIKGDVPFARIVILGVKDIDVEQKDAAYAAIRNILYRKGKAVEILECYEPNFTLMNEWYKQLFGESEGKDNKGLFPASCIFSTDLHSMGQFIQEGSRLMFETIVDVKKPAEDLFIEKLEGNFDGLNFLADQNMSVVNRKAMEGTILAHTDGGVPEVVLEVDDLTAYNVGYLIYFFWRACACSGYLLSVNPFNQPGVESYKKNMFALLGKPGYENLTAELEAKLK